MPTVSSAGISGSDPTSPARCATEYYGAGIITKRSGLFIARRIREGEGVFGVVVVKYEFDGLSQTWAGNPGQTLIVDANGIVLAAPDASQLLTTIQPLSPHARESIRSIGQYGDTALAPGAYALAGPDRNVGRRARASSTPRCRSSAPTCASCIS